MFQHNRATNKAKHYSVTPNDKHLLPPAINLDSTATRDGVSTIKKFDETVNVRHAGIASSDAIWHAMLGKKNPQYIQVSGCLNYEKQRGSIAILIHHTFTSDI